MNGKERKEDKIAELTAYYTALYGISYRFLPKASQELSLFVRMLYDNDFFKESENLYNPAAVTGITLDIIDKYIGVGRAVTNNGSQHQMDDEELRFLMSVKTRLNNMYPSIDNLNAVLHQLFGEKYRMLDSYAMAISYFFHSSLYKQVELMISKNLLPCPMGVLINFLCLHEQLYGHFGFKRYRIDDKKPGGFNSFHNQDRKAFLGYNDCLLYRT
jgi:hypothetical protein